MKKQKKDVKKDFDLKNNDDNELPKVKTGDVKEKKKHSGLGLWDKFKLRDKPDKSFLVEMIHSNNTSREFVIISNEETFTYKKRTYYLRYEDSRFSITHKEYKLVYHEDIAVPVDLEIMKKEDKSQTSEDKQKAYFSVTPHNLKPLLKMEYVKALAESQEISRYLKMIMIIVIIILVLVGFMAYQGIGGLNILGGG